MNPYTILDSIPNPWNWRFLLVAVAGSVVATTVAGMRAASPAAIPGLATLVVVVVLVIAGRSLLKSQSSLVENRVLRLAIAPLLLGLPPLAAAIAMGNPGAGGYPAALAVLLGLVMFTTRDLEHRALEDSRGSEEFPVHSIYRGTLAWVSTVFFFFGVASIWPWLGQIYGGGYFWILVVGVLMPTLFLWGRLRQPRSANSLEALVRFNRVLPYVGLILLIAILVG